MKPIIVAHKVNQTSHKKGVFRAFSSAFDMGADGIEFDVQLYHFRSAGRCVEEM